MIVVDTSVIASLFLPGTGTANAQEVMRRDPEWIAPLLWRSEFRNVLANYLRVGKLSLPDALLLAEEAEFVMNGAEFPVASQDVLQLVAQTKHSAYDCEFVALAQTRQVALVTLDKRLINSFPRTAISTARFIGSSENDEHD